MTPFLPSRDLLRPTDLAQRKWEQRIQFIERGLQHVALALGVVVGQSERVQVEVIEVADGEEISGQVEDDREKGKNRADPLEEQHVRSWLMQIGRLGWLQDVDEGHDDDDVERLVAEASRLLAILSGQAASGQVVREFCFALRPSGAADDSQISVRVADTAVVEDALGGRTWAAAPLLAHRVIHDMIRTGAIGSREGPLRILELGAGTGLVGLATAEALVLSNQSGQVHLSDFNTDVLRNLEHNIERNRERHGWHGVELRSLFLDWTDVDQHQSTCDYLLCADCIYEPQHAQLLHNVASKVLDRSYAIHATDLRSTQDGESSRGTMYILSPQRTTHRSDLDSLFSIFPDRSEDLDSTATEAVGVDDALRLCITSRVTFFLEERDNFGPPQLQLNSQTRHKTVRAYTMLTERATTLDLERWQDRMYSLVTVQWCHR